jgi:N-methylhydantoinase A
VTHYRVGIDIGGTFTDFALHDTRSNALTSIKVPTVPSDPVQGVIDGLHALRDEHGVALDKVGYFVHGTTIAVNALIERKGARLGLLVTRGFRDLLVIQRLRLPQPQNWYGFRPEPLIPRERVFEIDERLNADGSIGSPIAAPSLHEAIAEARRQQVDGLVLCFLHAFKNPQHELAAREFVRREAPELFVCCSHEILPQMREYERAIVSIINAYVMPPVNDYLSKLEGRLRQVGVEAAPYITRSNGGIMSARRARSSTAETLLSGPTSGVIGAVRVAQQAGVEDLITLDVGGTSADVAIVEKGRPQISLAEHIADFPIMMPVVGVSCVGAGGGSLAWMDEAGVLKVGPRSAGANPGPACFGKGQTQPTVTDAFLLCGFLNAETYAGGRIRLERRLSQQAMVPLAAQLGCDAEAAAEGVIAVAIAGMFAELSNLTAKRGIDARDFTLVGFGGAGALLACRLAEEMGMARVLIPQSPGTLCALGALSADVASDFVRSVFLRRGSDAGRLPAALQDLRREAVAWIESEAPFLKHYELSLSADMRYVGQSFEIGAPLEERFLEAGDWDAIADAFHAAHHRMYAHSQPKQAVEMINLRLRIAAAMPKPPLPMPPQLAAGTPAPRAGFRGVYTQGAHVDVPVHRRSELAGGHVLAGPALIDQSDTTVFVPAGWNGAVHESGNLMLTREAA